jgi:sec-independent protein translocase protein TatC
MTVIADTTPTAVLAGGRRATRPAASRLAVHALLAFAAAAQEMSFVEHLEELRKRILWSLGFLAVAFATCWAFVDELFALARAPIDATPDVAFVLLRAQDIVGLQLRVTLVAAIFLASPLILLQAWLFISPGLHPHERRYAVPFVVLASLLFVAGGAFSYYAAFPTTLAFLIAWIREAGITPTIEAVEYVNLFFQITIAFGLVFQIPAVVFVLSRIGLVTARGLVQYSRHAVLGCLLIAAVITPTTDFANMLIIAGPMIVLYAVGIGIAWIFGKPRGVTPD